eukprot:CAMPEP_0202690968 /NCGR_PEP_ID=MMETSP1385-20130828/5824_1 /ASSEMBLY_ACC=CAM_ASM_000861 /TAXON_ID=933848 /ORGANISM="Elphidium margaritaceum" /LENGTH=377 /DNA_ID=CAMNT_0049346309 /DNA_START=32 /DNA_END=1165 /DNA_ORIENTATION=+
MVRVTVDLLKKRAEHNDGILQSLEEITLHQYDIEKIELIQDHCKHLKILYLQNNQIEKIENLSKLKELQYLNLALNNISKIEGLCSCESLQKLDLTLNFINFKSLVDCISELKHNSFLSELHLTGNPCTDHCRYRMFVIYSLPQLRTLDALPIKSSERIKAKQMCSNIDWNASEWQSDDSKEDGYGHSVEARKASYCEDKEREERQRCENEERDQQNPFRKGKDVVKEARAKMCAIAKEGENGALPKQRNIGKYEFEMKGVDDLYAENITCVIEAPKYLDTSEIFVDIHPHWFQVIIKKKSLLLHLPTTVKANESRVRRLVCNGWLELIMPKTEFKKKKFGNEKNIQKNQAQAMQTSDGDDGGIIDSDDADDIPPLE